MAELKITDKAQGHEHVVLLYDNVHDGNIAGRTSKDSSHYHEVMYIPAQPPVTDPNTGQVTQEAQEAQIYVAPGKDGHAHSMETLFFTQKKVDEKERLEEDMKEALKCYNEALSFNVENFKSADEDEGFYIGGDRQWEPSVLNERRALQLPVITINKVSKIINTICGYFKQNDTDIKYLPVETGDQIIADILNSLAKIILEKNNFHNEFDKMRLNQANVGKGDCNLFIDTEYNPEGEIKLRLANWAQVLYGPHEREDLEDCEFLSFYEYVSLNYLKMLYPELASEIEGTRYFDGTANWKAKTVATDGFILNIPASMYSENRFFMDSDKKNLRLIRVQRKEYKKGVFLFHSEENFQLDITTIDIDKKRINQILSIPGFEKISKFSRRIKCTHFAGNILLKSEYSPFKMFTVWPLYAIKLGANFKGVMRDLKDPQREGNYRRSTAADIYRKMNGKGYFYDENTFADEAEKEKFLQSGSKVGWMAKVNTIGNIPIKEEGIGFPADMMKADEIASIEIREIAGVNEEMLGIANSNTNSSLLYNDRRNAALIGIEFMVSGASIFKIYLGKLLLQVIKHVYTPERVYRMLLGYEDRYQVKIGGKAASAYSKQEFLKIWQMADLNEYDVIVGETEYTKTKRQSDLKMWMSLAQQGVPIPPELFVDFSDAPPDQKNKLIEIMTKQQQFQQQLEVEKQKTERLKSGVQEPV